MFNGWTYEEEDGVSGTLTVTDNPSGGVIISIDVPGGIDGGGLAASRHDLPGFSKTVICLLNWNTVL